MRWVWLAPLGALLVAGCPSAHLRPTGPPPEYEKPVLPAWEAAAPVDPLENLGEGDWVDETGEEDAGHGAVDAVAAPDGSTDAAPVTDAGMPEGGATADSGATRPTGRKAGPAH